MEVADAVLELAERDEDYVRLREQHREHDRLLHHLSEKGRLTEEEDLEEKRLKKEKLALKDQMEAILRRYRDSAVA